MTMKQPKPGALLDQYLETIGLKRKPIPRDGLCLFRAVSEQLFLTQVYHTNLYEACRMVFVHCGMDPEKEWTEAEVMEILSLMYRRDFLIYETVGQSPTKTTNNKFSKEIVLCRVDDNQLDSVYATSYFESGAICQSIVYEILYRQVFRLDSELTEAVSLIREQNKKKLGLVSDRLFEGDDINKAFKDINISPRVRHQKKVLPPVPYRIAKALDPCIFRNVELDIWEEEKRDLLKRSPEYRERFSVGDKCQVTSEGEHLAGYIQEINDTDNTALVFIEEFGEKRTVPVSSLKLATSHRYNFKRRRQFLNYNIQTTPPRQGGFPFTTVRRQLDYQSVPSIQEADNCQPVPYTQVDNYQTQEPIFSNEGYFPGNPYYPTENGYGTTCYYTMDNVNQANGMTTYIQNGKNNANQYYAPTHIQQYGPPPVTGPVMNPYYYGSVVPQSNCVCVPYVESIAVKDVNMNCLPSQDYTGKDLPEINTLRFFFNLGVENYRMICQSGPVWPIMEVNGYDPQTQPANQMLGNTSGQFTLPPPPVLKILSPTTSHNFQHNFTTNQNFKVNKTQQGKESTQKDTEVPSVEVNVNGSDTSVKGTPNKEGNECNDSGCDSDSLGGSAQDDSSKENKNSLKVSIELEKSIDNFIASKDNETNETQENGAIEETVSSSSDQGGGYSKPRTKKKYYMYGSLKLVKPIKDIPPRFLSLLSDSSAERARCEGEPIIIPFLPPKKYHSYNNNYNNSNTNSDKTGTQSTASSSTTPTHFNPEAKCFVPGQMQSTIIHDPSVVAYCYDGSVKQEQMAVSENPVNTTNSHPSMYAGTGTPMYVPIPHTNLGNSSHSNPTSVHSHSNSLLGDGSKFSMHPSFSTGQACSTYPPHVPCPVYFTGPVPYQTGQGYIASGATATEMPMYYTAYNTGSQTYNLASQLPQIPAIQTAQ